MDWQQAEEVVYVRTGLDHVLRALTWWFVPVFIGFCLPLIAAAFWWVCGGEPVSKVMQSIGLVLDGIGFLAVASSIALGRREYDQKEMPPVGKLKWFERVEYIDEYSKFDVASAKLGVGLILSGFGFQLWGVLLN